MKLPPPKNALKFLRWFCREDYLEEIEGDLVELFEEQQESASRWANLAFYWQVLHYFRPDFIKSFHFNPVPQAAMLKNYFKVARRSMMKQKLYTAINIGGLTLGLTGFILIFLYVQHELSFDQFTDHPEEVYRVYQRMGGNEYQGSDKYAYTPVGLAPAMEAEFSEVAQATTFRDQSALLSREQSHFYEPGLWADEAFFQVFPYPFLHGNPATALQEGKSMILTASLAQKIFGQQNPIGEVLTFQNKEAFTVTGVLEDLPETATISFSFLTDIGSNGQYDYDLKGDQWNNSDYMTFCRLTPGANDLALQQKLPALLDKYWQQPENFPFKLSYQLQSLSDLHFEQGINFDTGIKGNMQYIRLFSIIAILVLLLACINYMNLAIARSIKRTREVGIRKVVGARYRQVLGQFLSESVLITFLALVLALLASQLLLPLVNNVLDRSIELNLLTNTWLLPGLAVLMIVVGLLSGSYPALVMSSLRPVQVLKGSKDRRLSDQKLQHWLMVGQYAVSVGLIICSLVIYRQFQYIQQKELGYQKEQVVVIPIQDRELRKHIPALKNEWAKNPNLLAVTTTSELPTNVTSNTKLRKAGEAKEAASLIYRARQGYDYLDVFSIPLLAGRTFSPDIQSDFEEGIILNESAAKAFGWSPEAAIGQSLLDHKSRTVIGVVKDFHMHSLHLEIAPLMMVMDDYFDQIAVKVRPENLGGTLTTLEAGLQQHSPYPFEYQFLNERFDQLYRSEQQMGELLLIFTLLAIFIASIGLFGLAAFMAKQKTKEIGIRKVLGASALEIVGLFTKNFTRSILLAIIIAIPVSFYLSRHWLGGFAYRIELQWWYFMLPGLAMLGLAWMTIGLQTIGAVRVNPVQCLKEE